jgi:hypothetical protein
MGDHAAGRLGVLREGDRIIIVHADPHVLIDTDMLDATRRGYTAATLDGDILRISGETTSGEPHTVVYRIGEPTPDGRAHHAQWPD